jgi:methylenetetrahydrofolate dehydrogenase (NADP+)/methenyltetrahydrofolate cyclohydrolase
MILSGREIAERLYENIRAEVARASGRRPPGLAVIQVGNNPASAAYIRQKERSAVGCGFRFEHLHLPAAVSKQELEQAIDKTAADPGLDGLILQLPLDSKGATDLNAFTGELLERIPPQKDADGLHTLNLGRLFAGESSSTRWTSPLPATAFGVMKILELSKIPVVGKRAVVVGRSRLVGMPVATLLSQEGATVTICHSKTADLGHHTRDAEILVVAAGRKHLIRPEHLSPGTVVIDVGIHDDGLSEAGKSKLTGDVHPEARAKASAYTPVPGGVGPMTVAGLLENAFLLYQNGLSR